MWIFQYGFIFLSCGKERKIKISYSLIFQKGKIYRYPWDVFLMLWTILGSGHDKQYAMRCPSMMTSRLKRKKMGATRARESTSSSVQRLVKFVPFIMHLNEFSFDNALLVIVKSWIVLPSTRKGFVRQVCVFHEKAFSIRSLCLLEEGFYVLEVNTFHEKGFCKQPLCLLGEELQYQKFMPSMRRAFSMSV